MIKILRSRRYRIFRVVISAVLWGVMVWAFLTVNAELGVVRDVYGY